MPKISQDSIPQRRVLSEPQLVEQLVDVPVPEMVILAHGSSGGCWWQTGTRHVKWDLPQAFTALGGIQILGAGLRCPQIQAQIVDAATPVADVPPCCTSSSSSSSSSSWRCLRSSFGHSSSDAEEGAQTVQKTVWRANCAEDHRDSTVPGWSSL